MAADPARTEITLHGDPRLVAAVGAVVTHASQRLGLTEQADALSASTMEVVREIFKKMGNRAEAPDAAVQVVVEDHPGQLEVIIEHPGEADSASGAAHTQSGPWKIWDNAKFESCNGTSRVVLTKFAPGKSPQA